MTSSKFDYEFNCILQFLISKSINNNMVATVAFESRCKDLNGNVAFFVVYDYNSGVIINIYDNNSKVIAIKWFDDIVIFHIVEGCHSRGVLTS